MRKFLLLGTVLVASTAWAFGGMGLGLKSSSHKSGVNSIGVHINGNGKADIKIASCTAYEGTGPQDDTTYAGGLAGLADDNQTQCRCPAGTKWDGSVCITSEGATCTSWTTNECGTGYYCQFSPTSDTEDPTEGVCKDVSDCGLYAVGNTGLSASDYGGDCSPNWWTAQSICASQNMHLISLEEMKCPPELGAECDADSNIHNQLHQNDHWSSTFKSGADAYWIYCFWDEGCSTGVQERSNEFDIICK